MGQYTLGRSVCQICGHVSAPEIGGGFKDGVGKILKFSSSIIVKVLAGQKPELEDSAVCPVCSNHSMISLSAPCGSRVEALFNLSNYST